MTNFDTEQLLDDQLETEQMLELTCPGYSAATDSINRAWEALRHCFVHDPKPDTTELASLVAILQKLSASLVQLKSVEFKFREGAIKHGEYSMKKHQFDQTHQPKDDESGIPPATLREIERRLNLL
ncbi:MAG: hypothetical protein AAFX93_15230 [Verrucomicrobiota bacterium]